MKYVLLKRFAAELESLSVAIQRTFYKQLRFLVQSLRHPSLRANKYDEGARYMASACEWTLPILLYHRRRLLCSTSNTAARELILHPRPLDKEKEIVHTLFII